MKSHVPAHMHQRTGAMALLQRAAQNHEPSIAERNALEAILADALGIDMQHPKAINPYQRHVAAAVCSLLDNQPDPDAIFKTRRLANWGEIEAIFEGSRLREQAIFTAGKDANVAHDPNMLTAIDSLCDHAREGYQKFMQQRMAEPSAAKSASLG